MTGFDEPLLRLVGIDKSFGHVTALDGVDFSVYASEIVALVGDNGAGKSTLVKIMSGAERPDSGTITFDGETVNFSTPVDAQRLGIETVYQDLALAPELDCAANLFLGRELKRRGLLALAGALDHRAMRVQAAEAFNRFGTTVKDVGVPVSNLSGGQRQAVAVVRAATFANRIVIMDEPTAALGVIQRRNVLDLIRRVRDSGISVVLISHNMPEVLDVADRVEVLRLGRHVAEFERGQMAIPDLVGAMTGAIAS